MDAVAMAVFLFNKMRFCYMTFITYLAEMAAERSVDQCRVDLRDESIGRGELESVTDT
jgi:hypothetical protein